MAALRSAGSCLRLGLLALAWASSPAEARLQRGSVRLGGGEADRPWQYLGKFGFGLGIGSYQIRVRLRDPAAVAAGKLDIEAFLDEDWDSAEALPACRRATQGPARGHARLVLAPAGEWSPWQGGEVFHVVRSHIWYFALSACHQGTATDVDFELRLQQFDGSELSFELLYMPATSVLTLLVLTVFSVRLALRCRRLHRSMGSVHPVVRALAAAVALQWVAQALGTLHLWAYRRDGLGLGLTDAVAEVCFMLSQVVSSTLLLAIAQGYTLPCSAVGEQTLARPFAAGVAVLHALLVGLGKAQGDASHKHHENEGAVGWAILAARVLLYAWFITGVRRLHRQGGLKLQSFLRSFELAGSAYFLAYPAIFMVVQFFAPYLRHPVMQVGLLAMQTSSSFWLADLFLSRGAYYEVSQLSASLLPGGSGGFSPVGGCKDD